MASAVKNLRQTVTFRATPAEVYHSLVDSRAHARFTNASARLSARPGGRFSHYDGSLNGFVLDLDKNRRIVLAWRSSDWPVGHYSIADFRLTKVAGGTRLEFSQWGIPAGDYKDIQEGWKLYYWEPLKTMLES